MQAEVNIVKKSNEIVWHQQFGHLGERNLQRLAKESLVDGLDYHVSKSIGFYETCVNEKNYIGISLLLTENKENTH